MYFFFTDTATTKIYTLSLHDALPIFHNRRNASSRLLLLISKHLILCIYLVFRKMRDRKSGSAGMPRPISYAVFCLKKKTRRCDGARTGTRRGAEHSEEVEGVDERVQT